MQKLKVLSLFSGIGGIDIGLEATGGFETVAFCEFDKDCQRVLKKNWPEVPIFKDVTGTYMGEGGLRDHYSISTEIREVDVICGGFPCQDISFAGARAGIIEGKKSSLWKEYYRIIKEVGPKYVIIENVEYLRKNGLGVVLNDLSRIGYDCEWACLTADAFGLPHQRKRLFLVSYPSRIGQHEYSGQELYLQTDQEWKDSQVDGQGKERESEFVEIRKILSPGSVEDFMHTRTDQRAAVSSVRRITNGIPCGNDERRRKARIKQLGNAVVPVIAEYIGKQILNYEELKWL